MVEGARLESVYTGNRIAGSNPAPSASISSYHFDFVLLNSDDIRHTPTTTPTTFIASANVRCQNAVAGVG